MNVFLKQSYKECALCNLEIKETYLTTDVCKCLFHRKCFQDRLNADLFDDDNKCLNSACGKSFTKLVIKRMTDKVCKEISFESSEKCCICYENIVKPFAQPESCNHYFCLECLQRWCKIKHECPIDRTKFNMIFLSDYPKGVIYKHIVPDPVEKKESDVEDNVVDVIVCEICHRGDDEDVLLLCDCCSKGYHTYCLPNSLEQIPDGDWFCSECENTQVAEDILMTYETQFGGRIGGVNYFRSVIDNIAERELGRSESPAFVSYASSSETDSDTTIANDSIQQPSTSRASDRRSAESSASSSPVKIVRRKRRQVRRRRKVSRLRKGTKRRTRKKTKRGPQSVIKKSIINTVLANDRHRTTRSISLISPTRRLPPRPPASSIRPLSTSSTLPSPISSRWIFRRN